MSEPQPTPSSGQPPPTTSTPIAAAGGEPGASGARAGARRGLAVTIAAVVGCLGLAGGLAAWALSGDDATDPDGGAAAGTGAGAHEGHDQQVLAGCDAEAYHHTMLMFDPTAADGLLDSGCTWPYDATIELSGGTDDPAIAVPYEAHRYAELFEVVTRERFGMCSVATLPDEKVDGFVFGFGVALNPAGCADNVATVQVDIREYATEAWRDTAANAAADGGVPHVMVLGRWVISVSGDDPDGAARFASLLEPLGAVTV